MKSLILIAATALVFITVYLWPSQVGSQSEALVKVTSSNSMPSLLPSVTSTETVTPAAHKTMPAVQPVQGVLSPAVQNQIKQLSSRDNSQAQAVEIKPGVFLTDISTIHQTVTVAAINADGSVQLTEH